MNYAQVNKAPSSNILKTKIDIVLQYLLKVQAGEQKPPLLIGLNNSIYTVTPLFCRWGWKIFSVGQKGGLVLFKFLVVEWVKRGEWIFSKGLWGFSESNKIKISHKFKKYINYSNSHNHNVLCLLTLFKFLLVKTFHEWKALISFKFANKDSIIRKIFWNFLMHYVNTTFNFFGNSLLKKGKYLVIESSYFCLE